MLAFYIFIKKYFLVSYLYLTYHLIISCNFLKELQSILFTYVSNKTYIWVGVCSLILLNLLNLTILFSYWVTTYLIFFIFTTTNVYTFIRKLSIIIFFITTYYLFNYYNMLLLYNILKYIIILLFLIFYLKKDITTYILTNYSTYRKFDFFFMVCNKVVWKVVFLYGHLINNQFKKARDQLRIINNTI